MSVENGATAAPATADGGIQISGGEPTPIGAGATIEHVIQNAGTVAPDKDAFQKMIPTEYVGDELVINSLKSENPLASIIKQLKDSQAMIGRQAAQGVQIPNEQSTPDQVKAFHKASGVPDDIKGYEITPVQWAPELKQVGDYLAQAKVPELMDPIKQAALEAGVTPKQLQKLVETHDLTVAKLNAAQIQQAQAQNVAMNEDFDTTANQLFGAQKNQVLEVGKQMIQQHVPNQLRPLLNGLDNKSLLILAAVANSMNTKFVREDSVSKIGAAPSVGGPQTSQEKTAAATPYMMHPGYGDPTHPEHRQLVQKVKQIFGTDRL